MQVIFYKLGKSLYDEHFVDSLVFFYFGIIYYKIIVFLFFNC